MSKVLHIRAISHEQPDFIRLLGQHGMQSLSLRDMSDADFDGREIILIEAHIDQRALLGHREVLGRHLDQGGTIVFNGHLVYPIFEGLDIFQVAQGRGVNDLVIERVHEHPVFEGVDCQDLSFRRGVAGFYARGANPAPEGAIVIHRLQADGSPIDWVWSRPKGGQIFMHSGNTMWMYLNDSTSAARIAPQLVNWAKSGAPAIRNTEGA